MEYIQYLYNLHRHGGDFKIWTDRGGMHIQCGEFEYNGTMGNFEECILNGTLFLMAKIMAKEMVETGSKEDK